MLRHQMSLHRLPHRGIEVIADAGYGRCLTARLWDVNDSRDSIELNVNEGYFTCRVIRAE